MFSKSKNDTLLLLDKKEKIMTRSSEKVKFKTEFTSITRVQNSPFYRGIAVWDTLPKHVQKLDSKIEFKRAIKSHMV